MDSPPTYRLIIGLGNPGRDYAQTRHNIGFMILDQLAKRSAAPFRFEGKWNAEIASHDGAMLCKPLGYMNASGEPVANVSRFYKIEPREMLVVFDDVALPLGKLRIRASGSAGGHNGMQSILDHLGTADIPRLRIGIGAADGRTLTHYVLGKFSAEEIPALNESLTRAIDAIDCAKTNGLEAAMNQFN